MLKLIVANPNYLRIMRGLKVPEDIYTHISGIDLIRNEDGKFFVLEDNLRTPSGVSYMLENREITRRLYPKFIPKNIECIVKAIADEIPKKTILFIYLWFVLK